MPIRLRALAIPVALAGLLSALPAGAQPAAGCDSSASCGGVCTDPDLLPLGAVNNFPKQLALVQAGNKINSYQQFVRDILAKDTANKVVNIADCDAAVAAIMADHTAKGGVNCIDVAIYGHGSPGSMKVGEDLLEPDTAAPAECIDKLLAQAGKICSLTLVGCEVGQGQVGQQLKGELSLGLGGIPVKAWTGRIWAYPKVYNPFPARQNRLWHEGDKKLVPTLSTWGLLFFAGLLMAAMFVAVRRRGAGAHAAASLLALVSIGLIAMSTTVAEDAPPVESCQANPQLVDLNDVFEG